MINKLVFSVFFVLVALFLISAPRAANAEEEKEPITGTFDLSTATAVAVKTTETTTTTVAPKNAAEAYLPTIEQCVERHKDALTQKLCVDEAKEAKAKTGGGPIKIVVECLPPAEKSKDGKSCDCPENFDAVLVDKVWHTRYVHKTYRCVVTELPDFKKVLVDVERDGPTKEDLDALRKRLENLERDGLVSPDDIKKLEERLKKLEEQMEGTCRVDENGTAHNCPSDIEVSVAVRGAWVFRSETDSQLVSLDLTGYFYPSYGPNGIYGGAIAGFARNPDINRGTFGGRVGWAHRTGMGEQDGHRHTLRFGGIVMSEPVVAGDNDSIAVGGELAFAFRGSKNPFFFEAGAIVGAERHAVYTPQATFVQRDLSDWGVLANLNLAAGLWW